MLGDRYRIEALIGAGGYGRVYRAIQLPIDREVAIKVVDPLDREAVARFRRELAFVKQLDHPNTVRVLDFGTSERGLPFIVMEYLRGRSVFELLTEHTRFAPAIALEITAQVLMALAEAHAMGIVHRDIKPENVFVTSHVGQPVFVKVLDFGIAKRRHGNESTVTVHGEAPGTPSYMAPEQIYAMEPDARTDLYAVGLMLAEMLTGRTVYGEGGVQTILRAQASPTPAPLDPILSGMVGADIVHKATQKAPRDRYASATEMLAVVEAALVATRGGPRRQEPARRERTTRAMAMPVITPAQPTAAVTPQHHPSPITGVRVVAPSPTTLPFKVPARTERSRGIFALAIAGIVLGIGLMALAAAFMLRPMAPARDDDAPPRVRRDRVVEAPSATTVAPPPPPETDRIRRARITDLEVARQILTDDGYEIEPSSGPDDHALRAIKGTCVGTILFTDLPSDGAAIQFASDAFAQNGASYAVYDKGRVVVIFMRHTMGNKATDRCTRPIFDRLVAP